MANSIALASKFVPILDEVYKQNAKTAVLDARPEFVRETEQANTIRIAKIAMDGLGDYGRNTGYVDGDVTFAWETHTFAQDRGRRFGIDDEDDKETVNMAFASLSGQFVKQKVGPEVDAYRFSTLFSKLESGYSAEATLSTSTVMPAVDTAIQKLQDAEVDLETAVLFITPEVSRLLKGTDALSRQFVVNIGNQEVNREVEVLDGIPVIVVPQSRMYTAIDLLDGEDSESAGGYAKASAGKDINFVLVDAASMLGVVKTARPKIIDPLANQSSDQWLYMYRLYHDFFVPDNKKFGIYIHHKAA